MDKFYSSSRFGQIKITRKITVLLIGLFFSGQLFSQTTNISGVVNTYHKVLEIIPVKACVRVTNVGALDVNSYAMLIQMKGATIVTGTGSTFGDTLALNNAGNYEIGTICSIIGDSVFFFHNLLNNYDTAGKVQLVQFAQHYSINVLDTVKAARWDSVAGTGGVVALYADQDITLTKPVWADSMGYRGGRYVIHNNDCINGLATNYAYNPNTTTGFSTGAYKGEGVANLTLNQSGGRGAPANGGGGGNNHNNSGGGGANLRLGGLGGGNSSNAGNCSSTRRGGAGKALSSWNGIKIFAGGGGGSGHANHGIFTKGGGNGGGIIFIWANNLIGNGQLVTASGGVGGQSQSDGAGGGGAGGTIIMHVNNYTGNTVIRARGGDGGNSNDAGNVGYCYGGGGGGSGGVIYFTGAAPVVTQSVIGGSAGVESGRDATCAAEQAALPGTDGDIIPNYTFRRSFDEAGYCEMLLPVDMVSFNATLVNKKVLLKWEIGNPRTVNKFIIERSVNAGNWMLLGTVHANEQVNVYAMIDQDPIPGKVYYRIKFLEKNNNISFSPTRMIVTGEKEEFVYYPNPAKDKIIITGNHTIPATLKLVDLSGKIVLERTITRSMTEIDLSHLPRGLYLLKLNQSVQKLMLR